MLCSVGGGSRSAGDAKRQLASVPGILETTHSRGVCFHFTQISRKFAHLLLPRKSLRLQGKKIFFLPGYISEWPKTNINSVHGVGVVSLLLPRAIRMDWRKHTTTTAINPLHARLFCDLNFFLLLRTTLWDAEEFCLDRTVSRGGGGGRNHASFASFFPDLLTAYACDVQGQGFFFSQI